MEILDALKKVTESIKEYVDEHKGDVKTVNGNAPDENGNVEIKISSDSSENGEDGFSPIATVTQTDTGAVISITDKDGTTTATVTNGKDGVDGEKGEKGDKGATGANGVSPTVSVSKSGKVTTITITDANGTKTATINDGEDGSTGAVGATGATGSDGEDYVLTNADKTEIAEMVENATIIQAPKYVSSVEEMTDTDRPYVLISTGRIWANADVTVAGTKKEVAGMPLSDNSRLGSDGSTATDATSYAAYVATDYIDLLAYPIPFQLHIDGGIFLPASADSYTRMGTYTADKTKINVLQQIQNGIDQILNVPDSDVTVDSNNNITITFNQTPMTNNANNDGVLRYVRFSGKGEPDTVNVYVTYEAETTGVQWFDTGTTYAAVLTDADKEEIAAEVAELVDAQLLAVIGDGAVTV